MSDVLPAPAEQYERRNEAEMRRQLERTIAALRAEIADIKRRLTAAAIP